MTLLEFHADLTRVANALEQIAHYLEMIVIPIPAADPHVRQATLDDLHTVSAEDVERMQAEQLEFAARYRVAPNSPAMMEALADWEAQQRMIHGETWKPPDDWRALFAAVAGSGDVRESASTGSARSR